ncbi:MAG: nicotinate-nucleotide--dimethylbenzimidazole phosphoribosyltransferase [Nitratireductor sp.]
MPVTGLPFDDIRTVIASLAGPDERAVGAVVSRNAQLFGQAGAGRIAAICEWMAAWSGKSPAVNRPLVALFAGTHGAQNEVARAAVPETVSAIAAGGAAINQICSAHELGLKVFDLALAYPTGNITEQEALSERDCAATIAFGMEAVSGGVDLMVAGSCVDAAGFSPAAIFSALHDCDPSSWASAPLDIGIAKAAIAHHGKAVSDPLEALRRLGGRETAAIAGSIIAARVQHVPLLLDGPHALAAAAVLKALNSDAISHCRLGQGHGNAHSKAMAETLGLEPLLDLAMGLEHGEGGALAMVMAKTAAAMHSGTVTQ